MLIINTAGHIDHGKSSVITALNGFVGDSTPEEIKRGITIDLSFSNMEDISFVDVPGHENLLKTMIAGVQGEYAMLVVDINEGIMPQTREHIFILNILGINKIILVLNKIDKCDNIKESELNILNELNFKPFAKFLVSAKSNEGIKELKDFLLNLKSPTYEDFALKINVDRVFSVKGIGNVATGFLKSGELKAGEYLVDNKKGISIKDIQVQHKSIESIKAPARVAFSFKGELKKGDIVYSKGFLRSSKEVYCTIKGELNHNETILFCSGNKQIEARYLEFDRFAKFILKEEAAFSFDDAYIVLKNARAVAGGRILNPITEPLKKSKMIELLGFLELKDFKKAFELLGNSHGLGFGLFCSPQRFNMTTKQALEYAKMTDNIVDLKGACVYTQDALNQVINQIKSMFSKNPYSLQSAKSLEKSLKIDEFLCEMALKGIEFLEQNNGLYYKKGVDVKKALENNEDLIYKELDRLTPLAPYNIYDELNLDRKSGDDIIKRLCSKNKVLRLAHNYFISTKALDEFLKSLNDDLKTGVDVQSLKNKYNLSRKYAICILEYLDRQKGIQNIDNKRYSVSNQKF